MIPKIERIIIRHENNEMLATSISWLGFRMIVAFDEVLEREWGIGAN